jgi:hypothetical protein
MRTRDFLPLVLAAAIALGGVMGCDNPGTVEKPNQMPEVLLSSGPANGSANVNYKVHFYWHGFDPDGRVERFEYMVTNDEVTGSLIIDEHIYERLAALDAAYPEVDYSWRSIEVHDTIISVTADSIPVADGGADSLYFYGDDRFLFRAHHTFFIRAVDEDRRHLEAAAHRTHGHDDRAGEDQPSVRHQRRRRHDNMPQDIFFRWTGNDSSGRHGDRPDHALPS